jgi:hypothetical protein
MKGLSYENGTGTGEGTISWNRREEIQEDRTYTCNTVG